MDKSACEARVKELHAAGEVLRAVELCESASCSEVEYCQRYVGWFYFQRGELEKSLSWYVKPALQGNADARTDCWKVILRIDAEGGRERAIRLAETPPYSEFPECQQYLAKAHFLQRDMEKTLYWCLKIAERGGGDDLAYVGILYHSRHQPELALDFFKRAIAAGNVRANHLIGELYAFGMGVPKDVALAMSYYEKSAASGFFLGKLRVLHLKRSQGGPLANLVFLVRMPALIAKLIWAKWRNPKDPRLVDVPAAPTREKPLTA